MACRLLKEGLTFIAAAISLASSGSNCGFGSCGGSISGSGTIQSPNYPSEYPNKCNCTWTFQSAAGHVEIVLQLSNISTEERHDFLTISGANGTRLSFSGSHPMQNIILHAPATIRFTTDSTIAKEGFKIKFNTISLSKDGDCGGCGGNIYGSGTIQSPNFPNNYPNLCNCTWTFRAEAGHVEIVLKLSNIFTEEKFDFLYISDSRGTQRSFSGNYPMQNIILHAPATIRFTTNALKVKQGFRIQFNTILLSRGVSLNSSTQGPSTKDTKEAGNSSFDDDSPDSRSNPENSGITASGFKDRPSSETSAVESGQCTGVVVGATVGTLTFTTLVIAIALIVRRRSQSKKKSAAQVNSATERGEEAIAMEDNPVYG